MRDHARHDGVSCSPVIANMRTGCWSTSDAWRDRILQNGGNVPTNIGLNGAIGGEWDGKWYGGTFGWNFDPAKQFPELLHARRTNRHGQRLSAHA